MSAETELPAPGYETSDASVGGVALSLGIVAFGIAAGLATCAILYTGRHAHELPPRPIGADASFHHGPDERTSVAQDWIKQDAAVWTHLHSYGWVDRAHGIVRVPINRAIELELSEAKTGAAAPQKGAGESR